MIYNITIGEHCFGPIARINDMGIIDYGYDDSKINLDLAKFVFDTLRKIKFTNNGINTMMGILHGRNRTFDLTEEEYNILESDPDEDYAIVFQKMCEKINYDINLIINEMEKSQDEFDSMDWFNLLDIIVGSNNLTKTDKSYRSDCDQCGNWNYMDYYELEI